jgi:hypothetical protein
MKGKYLILLASMGFAALLHGPSPALAQVSLGAAKSFALLGGPAVSCKDSIVTGNVGVNLGGAVTQVRCTISGTVHVGDTVAQQAYKDFVAAYAALGRKPCDVTLTGLAGQFLPPGVYCFAAFVAQTGGLPLTLLGPPDGIWIFKIGNPVTPTAYLELTNFSVVMPGGKTCNNNVFWWTADYATLTDSVFIGSILAGAAITATRGSLDGRALAKAAVTLVGAASPLQLKVCGGLQQGQDGEDGHHDGEDGHHDGEDGHHDGEDGHHDGDKGNNDHSGDNNSNHKCPSGQKC